MTPFSKFQKKAAGSADRAGSAPRGELLGGRRGLARGRASWRRQEEEVEADGQRAVPAPGESPVDALVGQPEVLTIPEVAKILRISRGAAYMAARRGEIPCFRVGRSLRVSRAAMVTWLGQGGVSRNGNDP